MADCSHDAALALDESDIHETRRKMLAYTQVFFCPDCGAYINAEAHVIEDPTLENTSGGSQPFVKSTATTEEGEAVQRSVGQEDVPQGQGDNGNGAMQLAPGTEAVSGGVSTVPPKRGRGAKLLPGDASAASASGASPGAQTQATPKGRLVAGEVLPGPWNGAPCPNMTIGCKGTLVPFHTLVSENSGNTYMYRCPEDGVQVGIDFKMVSDPARYQ